jgi:site-specific recombinase XerD
VSDFSIGALVARYLEERAVVWSASTLDNQRRGLACFVCHAGGDGTLTRESVLSFMRAIEKRCRRDGRPWSALTQQWALRALRGLLRWTLRRGILLEDLPSLIVLKRIQPLPRGLGESQVERLIEQGCGGGEALRDRALLELFYGTGLRASELGRLCVSDVALGEQLLHVREGKGRKDRMLPFGDRARNALLDYLRVRHVKEGPLFLSFRGRPLSRVMLWRVVRRAGQRAGVVASPHRLRHSFATHLIRHGASLPAVQALLGHQSLSATEVYLAVEVSDLARMIERSHPQERGKVRR